MPSSIDPTLPVSGTPTTASVRQNFQYAKNEIEALQSAAAPIASPALTGNPTAPTPTAGDNDTSIATTQFVTGAIATAVASATGNNNVGRNQLHNSMFNILQRGAGPFTVGGYTADRWALNFNMDTGVSASAVALNDAARTQIGDESAIWCLQVSTTGNAADAAYTLFNQAIETAWRLAGKTVTVSFWATASANGFKLGVNGSTFYGTGGSPSAPGVFQTTGIAISLTTAWIRYTATFAVPSRAGKTFGSAGNDFTSIQFWMSSGLTNNAQAGNIGRQTGTVQIWGVQCEVGSVATPLEKIDYQIELAKCMRFYQGVGIYITANLSLAGGSFGTGVSFPVPMRTTPTLNITSNASTNLSGVVANNLAGNFGVAASGNVITGGNQSTLSLTVTASADL